MADINKAQGNLLGTNFLDDLAKNQNFTKDLSALPLTQRLLIEAAAVFVQNARENIQKPKNGRTLISSGSLFDSVYASDLRVKGNSLAIDLGYKGKGAKYADFVNLGVKGIEDKRRAPNSPYSFKEENGLAPSPKFRKALEEWIKKNRQAIKNTKGNVNFSKAKGGRTVGARALQSKRKKISELSKVKNIAYAIGTNIRKKGLRRSGFFDNALNSTFNENFYSALASVVGADVSIGLRKLNNLSNK